MRILSFLNRPGVLFVAVCVALYLICAMPGRHPADHVMLKVCGTDRTYDQADLIRRHRATCPVCGAARPALIAYVENQP